MRVFVYFALESSPGARTLLSYFFGLNLKYSSAYADISDLTIGKLRRMSERFIFNYKKINRKINQTEIKCLLMVHETIQSLDLWFVVHDISSPVRD